MRVHFKPDRRWRSADLTSALGVAIDAAGRLEVAEPPAAGALAALVAFSERGVRHAALVCAPDSGVAVNGFAPLGVAVLEDRDEITVRGRILHFAAFEPPRAVPVPHLDGELRCARCKRPLREGDAMVRCPLCRGAHHEGPLAGMAGAERRCFSYDRCASCFRQLADLLWSPADYDGDEASGDD